MKNTTFRPQLCPNQQVDLTAIEYPLLASFKLDGIRAIIMNGELYSRALKVIANENIHKRFKDLKEYSKKHNVILDGELYTDSVTFNELSGIIRSDNKELPDDLEFWCFDLLTEENKPFAERVRDYTSIRHPYFHPLVQKEVFSPAMVQLGFKFALDNGFEGLILRNPTSQYKFGRATIKENIAFKVKAYETFDNKIIDVTQATEVKEGAEKKINELGRSVTSQKKDDRVLIEKAATFVVLHDGKECGISLPMTDEEKLDIWKHKNKYIGRTIEYKGMEIGSKDVPRHCVFIRFRDDK